MTRLDGLKWLNGKLILLTVALLLVADTLVLTLLSNDDNDRLSRHRQQVTQLEAQLHGLTDDKTPGALDIGELRHRIQALRPKLDFVVLDPQFSLLSEVSDSDQFSIPAPETLKQHVAPASRQAGLGDFRLIRRPQQWLALVPLVSQPLQQKPGTPAYLLLPLPKASHQSLWNNELFPAVILFNGALGLLLWLAYTRHSSAPKPLPVHYRDFTPESGFSMPPVLLSPNPKANQSEALRFVAQSEFTALLQSIPDAALIFDHHKRVIEANSAALELLAVEPSQLENQLIDSVIDLYDRHGHPLLKRPASELLPNRGDILSFSDCQLNTHQGNTQLVSLTLSCLSRGTKGQRRAVLIISDESALEQMRYESQQQKYLLNAMYSHTPALVYLKDRRSVYLMVNQSFAEFVGQAQQQIVGQQPQQLFKDEKLHQLHALEQEVLDTGLPVTREIQHSGRSPRTFLYQEFPLKDSLGDVRYTGGIASDVTTERQLEDTLQALATDSSAKSGDSFFSSLVRQLQRLTGADFVLVGEVLDGTEQLHVIAANHRGSPYPPFCYDATDTPCAVTLQGKDHQQDELGQHYPKDLIYQSLRLNSYLGKPLLDSQGQTIGLLGLLFESRPDNHQWINDTLELFCGRVSAELSRERLQRHLQRLSSKLSSHIENTPLAVIEWSPDYSVLSWNRSAEKLFGYSAQQAIGRSLNKLIIAPIRWAYDSAILNHLVINRTNNKCTHTNVSQDGKEILCEWENTVILNEVNEVESVISVIKDVTAERRLLFQLQQKELEQRQMLNSMVDAIITIDSKGLTTSFNRSAETLFGYTERDILGQNVKLLMPANVSQHHDRYLSEHRRTGVTRFIGTSREVIGRKSNGSEFPMRLSVNKLQSSKNDDEPHFIGTCTDISEEKQKDEQLKHSMKMDALGRLTGGVAHDFNNILGIVSGYAELLDMTLDDDSLRQYASEILKASHRGERLTSRLLKFTRKRAAEPRPLDINTTLEEQRDMLQRSLTPRIDIQYQLAANLAPVALDASEFEDALLNLCINAKHAMNGQGRITIQTFAHQRVSSASDEVIKRHWVVMQVEDEGIGMSEDIKQRIFEPFFSTKDEEKGTGLGLSQVYGFVERSGGFIEVDSAPDQGARFRLYFPALENEQHPMDEEVTMTSPYQGHETLLIVDDEVALADVLTTTLKHYGYQLISANSAEQALKLLQEHSVDLVISDVVMKHKSGFELARQVKQDYKLPVLLISGYYDESERRSNDHSYAQLIHKPFSARTLLEAIRQTLNQEGGQHQ